MAVFPFLSQNTSGKVMGVGTIRCLFVWQALKLGDDRPSCERENLKTKTLTKVFLGCKILID